MRPLTRRGALGLIGAGALGAGALTLPACTRFEGATLLNASYDSTRELYTALNTAFAAQWQHESGRTVSVLQSHGASGGQARAIINGLQADVATLASAYDVLQLYRQARLIPADWESRLPYNSCPYTSTIVFLVRQGNPKNIHDWADLVRPGVQVITPNPKTSGAARWAYLAAWAWAVRQPGVGPAGVLGYMRSLYQHVPVLDSGSRGAADTFIERGIGDVLLSWENEALLAQHNLAENGFAIVVPPVSVLAETPVTLVDAVVDRRGTRALATAYLQFLYTPAGQQIIAEHYFRPRLAALAQRFAGLFPPVARMVTVDQEFGGWQHAQAVHFDDGGTFDHIYGQ